MNRTFDLICLGRAAVDFYGQQVGGRFEDVQVTGPHGLVPVDGARVYPVSGGAEAVETALKMARAYHLARGEDRWRVIGRQGRTIRAIRTVVKAASVKAGKRVTVEVPD